MEELTWKKVKEELKEVNETSREIIEEADAYVDIIAAIYNKRKELGISQRQLAKLCKLPQSSIARIETKDVNPYLQTLLKILWPLGLTLKVVPLSN